MKARVQYIAALALTALVAIGIVSVSYAIVYYLLSLTGNQMATSLISAMTCVCMALMIIDWYQELFDRVHRIIRKQ